MNRHGIGSVVSGTMRAEDLIPAFLAELRSLKPIRAAHRRVAREIEKRADAQAGYWDSDEPHEDVCELIDILGGYAMPYCYFGSHPGDGADYGWWLIEDWDQDRELLKVNDLTEIPSGHVGEVALVNDHGNVTLYNIGLNGHRYEIWAVV